MNQEKNSFFSTLKKDFQTSFSINFLFIIIILSTFSIILTNYIFSKSIIKEVHFIIQNYEYSKVGGEENYKILREIQKEQTNSYITDMIENNPEYIEEIKAKIDPQYKKAKKLSQEEISILKEWSNIIWSQDAQYTFVEFSNFTCKYCREFHQTDILPWLLEKYEDLNYILKNMVHKQSTPEYQLALYGKCILQQGDTEKYSQYISEVFSLSWEEQNDFLENISWKYLLSQEIQTCISSPETKLFLEKEFGQWIYLWVTSTPSFIVLDNTTGKYTFIEWLVSKEDMIKSIDAFMGKN